MKTMPSTLAIDLTWQARAILLFYCMLAYLDHGDVFAAADVLPL